jgi:transposase
MDSHNSRLLADLHGRKGEQGARHRPREHLISTGPLEGTNTKIKLLQRQAYGFRDTDFFKLRIMGLHESRIALVG